MTFEVFKKIAEKYRPDVRVSKHGDYCNSKSGNTLGIIFIKDGHESKVYNYSGSYATILNKLGVLIVTKSDYDTAITHLERCKERHGTKSLFSKSICDCSAEIEHWENILAEYNSDKYIRDWEL